MKILIRAAIIVCIVVIAVYIGDALERADTASTIKRIPLPAGSVNETGYFTEDYRIEDAFTLEKGLKHFYNMTGVQPYVHIVTSIDGHENPWNRDLTAYARTLYPQLFTDESHMLFLIYDHHPFNTYDHPVSYYYEYYIVCGSKAKTVMDAEAENILFDYIRWYSDPDLSFDEIFGEAFSDAGDRIMSITLPPWIPVLIISGMLVLLALLFPQLKKINMQKRLKAQQDAEILRVPLEQYGAEGKAESTPQNCGNISEIKYGDGAAAVKMAQIKHLIDENAAETAKYAGLARQALQAGREDEARIFIEKKQKLETSKAALDTAYTNFARIHQARNKIMSGMRNGLPKDEAEALAEKYAARGSIYQARTSPSARRFARGSAASVNDELAKMKKDMGL